MDKRTETVSARITPELLQQLYGIALARDVTISDLINTCLAQDAERERERYLRLRRAFESAPDLPGLPR